MYPMVVFKSLMFETSGRHPDRREPGGCPGWGFMLFVKESQTRAAPERVFAAPGAGGGSLKGAATLMGRGNRTPGGAGFFIIGLSLALLVGIALLKGGADPGGELDE